MSNCLDGLNWGDFPIFLKETLLQEFSSDCYTSVVPIREGDIVFDFGASIGFFPYSMKQVQLEHIYCIEPCHELIPALIHNLNNCCFDSSIIYGAVSEEDEEFVLFGSELKIRREDCYKQKAPFLNFQKLLQITGVEKIDYIKTDCEGGEYSIFNEINIPWIKKNVSRAVGEWHLGTPELKVKFKNFAPLLKEFKFFQINDISGYNITESFLNDLSGFINYYQEIIIHINNE